MHRFSGYVRASESSRLARFLLVGVLFLFAIARPLGAQSKADAGVPPCVPSELNSLIVTDGRTVHVSELREGLDRSGSGGANASVSDPARKASDAQERKEAHEVFAKEARRGNPAGMVNLAVSSLAGWGGKLNAGEALYWLHAAADREYGPAFYDLGIVYFKGCGVRRDMAEAFHFFELGAKVGDAAAQVNLGYFYDRGLGVVQDRSAAAHWYLLASESGEAQAQYNLADLYLHGEGVAKDEPTAFAWFQKAALQGHTGGRMMMASMLAAGRGTSKDLAGAYFWVFASVLQGDNRGLLLLGTLERQLSGSEVEQAKARAQLLLAGLQASKNK